MSAIIEIELTHRTANSERYRVWHDGAVLIQSARDPLCEGARALVKKGVTGRVRMRRVGKTGYDIEGLIAVLAPLTVAEGQQHGPRFVKWTEFERPEAAE